MTVLYRGQRYLVRYNRVSEARLAVVSFDPWTHESDLDAPFFAEAFFRSRGINAIGIKCAYNDWYMDAEIEPVLRAVRMATLGQRLVSYGGSMGGYAAINFAHILNIDCAIALAPQASPDPQRVPFEQRWQEERSSLDCSRDRFGRPAARVCGYVLYDPTMADDVQHVRMLMGEHDLISVPMLCAEHHPLLMLNETNLTESMLLSMVHGQFDRADFLRDLRFRRRQSTRFWLRLAYRLTARRRKWRSWDSWLARRSERFLATSRWKR